jgi:hypothetical protein
MRSKDAWQLTQNRRAIGSGRAVRVFDQPPDMVFRRQASRVQCRRARGGVAIAYQINSASRLVRIRLAI